MNFVKKKKKKNRKNAEWCSHKWKVFQKEAEEKLSRTRI